MDPNMVVEIITKLGFPISICCLLVYLIYVISKQFRGDIKELWTQNFEYLKRLDKITTSLELTAKELEDLEQAIREWGRGETNEGD